MATLELIDVPDIGDFTDIPITEVFVSVGDRVDVEAPLVEIESDKATMEVPSPMAGVIKELRVKVGDTVSQGSPLVVLEVAGEAPAPEAETAAPTSEAAAPAAVASAVAAEAQADTSEAPVHASPVARRMARELGVDIGAVVGSGRQGRITKDDVVAAANGGPSEHPTPSQGTTADSSE
ncbi:MAG: hypothetical protein QOG68_1477, partial [Solirubrobacteraceae bacterium]|nr:hypothetical protein [Solirubrobacteraceae bacterium]